MSGERWIWVELIGFDNTREECGVQEYLDRIGFVPEGISLLLSSSDFVFLHKNTDYELFPDVCSRQGHEYNEDRSRQVWWSSQLQRLISALQRRGVKVFFTISMMYLHNEFHTEWCSQFGRSRASLIGRLPDGSIVADHFTSRLKEVLKFYNFDGYHISDGVVPDGNITDEGYCTYNNFLHQFNESIGGKFPSEWFDIEIPGDFFDERRKRGRFIRENFQKEYSGFISRRWAEILRSISDTVHDAGKMLMMNSVAAKGIFETLVFCGFDMRLLAETVDILVVESVATSMSLISGNYDKLFDFTAITMEMRAIFPQMKIINLTGCKDVVESFDSIRNAPVLLERDIYVLGNCYSAGKRCSDGMMFCLGDGITRPEWEFLETLYRQTYSFEATGADGRKLFLSVELYDSMYDTYLTAGSAPSYIYAAELMKRGVEIFNVAVDSSEKGALFVPNFNFLAPEVQKKVLERKDPTLVISESDSMFTILPLNIPGAEKFSVPFAKEDFDSFARFDLFNDRIPLRTIPEKLLAGAAQIMRNIPGMVNPLNNPQENFFISVHNDWARRCGICSKLDYYTVAECTFADHENANLSKVSSFPVHDLQLTDGKLVCRKSRSTADYYGALRIPPKGIFIFDITQTKEKKL